MFFFRATFGLEKQWLGRHPGAGSFGSVIARTSGSRVDL